MSNKDKSVEITENDVGNEPSAPVSQSSIEKGVCGSKYLASEEEHRKFAEEHPGEIIFGFGAYQSTKK